MKPLSKMAAENPEVAMLRAVFGQRHDELYREGRRDGLVGMIHLLADCRTPRSLFVRVEVLRHFIAPNETIEDLARRCRVSTRLIYREISEIRTFTEFTVDPQQTGHEPK